MGSAPTASNARVTDEPSEAPDASTTGYHLDGGQTAPDPMSFSERMKESLGTEGARVQVEAPSEAVTPGQAANAKVRIVGGTKEARIDALVVRVIEARRHWMREDGSRLSEQEAPAAERRAMMPSWERRVVHQMNVEVGETVAAHAEHELEIEVQIPEGCGSTDHACVITLNAQADIKEQIDPTGTATLLVSAS